MNDASENWRYPRPRFWTDKNLWPRVPEGLIFLAQAYQQVGEMLFGAEWSPAVVSAVRIEDFPSSPAVASLDDFELAVKILGHYRPGWELPGTTALANLGQNLALLGQERASLRQERGMLPEDWDFVHQKVREAQEARRPQIAMRGEITEWFSLRVHDRALIDVYGVQLRGGPIIPATRAFFNTTPLGFDHILENCSINGDTPFDRQALRTHYLFLDRAQFERTLSAEIPSPSPSEEGRRPEYIGGSHSIGDSQASNSDPEAAARQVIEGVDGGGADWWRNGNLTAVRRDAANFLRADKCLTIQQLLGLLTPAWPDLTRNFLRTRVWVEARIAADLDPAGTPGKRKGNPAG